MADAVNDTLTERIIGLCFEVHNKLGPGFTEKIYHNALIVLLKRDNIGFESEKKFIVSFDGVSVGDFRADLIIEKELIVELKAVEGIMPKVFTNKLISYLKAAQISRALLVNFGNASCVIKRVSYKSKLE